MALAKAVAQSAKDTKDTKENENEYPAKLWRWARHGHGKYKGKWYRWVNIANRAITLPGGVLTDAMRAELEQSHPRTGKGDRTKGTNRKPRRTKDTNAQ